MRQKNAVLAGAALLLLLGAGAFLWSAGEGTGPAAPPRPAHSAEVPAPGAPTRGTDPATPSVVSGSDPAPAPKAAAPAVPAPAGTKFLLRGRLRGLPPEAKDPARLVVTPVGLDAAEERAEGVSAPDGTVDVDVTGAFPAGKAIVEIEIAIDQPDCLPAKAKAAVPPAAPGGGPVVIPFEATLVAAAILHGRVLDAAGAPVPGAAVGAFPILEGEPDETAVDESPVGADGAWRLRLKRGVRYLVVAAAEGKAPASGEAEGGETASPELVLAEGASISGRVTDPRGGPLSGVLVGSDPTALPESWKLLDVGDAEVMWWNGSLRTGDASGITGADGAYRITGLDGTPREVKVELVPGTDALSDAFSDGAREATPPAENVDFAPATVRLLLHVRKDGVPAAGESLLLIGRGRHLFTFSTVADSAGTVALLGRAGGAYRATLSGCEGSLDIEVPAAPGTVLDRTLEFATPHRGTLVVIPEAPGGVPVERIGVGFFQAGTEAVPSSERDIACVSRDLTAADGRFRVTDVDPGTYCLVVRAGGTWMGGQGYFTEEAVAAEVPAAGEREIRVRLCPGGRLRISAKDGAGRFVAAHCAVEDLAGSPMPVTFVVRDSGSLSFSTGDLGYEGPSNVEPALKAGRYTVRLTMDGFLDRVESVDVEKGKTAEVSVTMEPK